MHRSGVLNLLFLGCAAALGHRLDVTQPPPSVIILDDGVTEPYPVDPIILDDEIDGQGSSHYEMSEELFEGDIMLTDEQKKALLSRKALPGTSGEWPKSADGGVDIYYRYRDSTIDQAGVQVGIDRWEETTCIRFHELPRYRRVPHLAFTHSETSCSSYIGLVFSTGQIINLTPGCVSEGGPVMHEIGHALGLYHEQSRSDRDSYVNIMLGNVIAGYEGNFYKRTTDNYGLPYDYSSSMHYGPNYFTSNGQNTVETKDPFAQPLIGQRDDISFMDIKIINLKYDCIDKWLGECGLAIDPCQNHGYTNSNCECECPAGTSGDNCENLDMPYTNALIVALTPNSENITRESTISSPLFPAPVNTEMAYVQLITAPECYTVKITFLTFDLYPKTDLGRGPMCNVMALEIRTGDPPQSGTVYCGTDIMDGQVFTSTGRSLALIFSSQTNSDAYTGYNVAVEFVRDSSAECETTTASTTDTTSTTTTILPDSITTTTILPDSITTTILPDSITTTIFPDSTTTTTLPATTTTTLPATTTTTLPATTTTAAPSCIVTNSGILPLIASFRGSCSLTQVSPTTFTLTSPNYPSRYSRRSYCRGRFSTEEPRYIRVTATEVDIGRRDGLIFYYMHRNFKRVTNAMEGGQFTPLTSSMMMAFMSARFNCGNRFAFNMEVVNTDCHQIIDIPLGATCTLSIPPNYPSGTICEWWIRAPAGSRVRVEFSRFDVGDGRCRKDFMVIDKRGDKRYMRSGRYCGDAGSSPTTVTSETNKMNIFLNGQEGNYGGFEATIHTVA